jgi:hypothetical protein
MESPGPRSGDPNRVGLAVAHGRPESVLRGCNYAFGSRAGSRLYDAGILRPADGVRSYRREAFAIFGEGSGNSLTSGWACRAVKQV